MQNESGIEFSFDFSKVYWNSRLSHEHERLIDIFNKGDIIADGFAGVGPFAVPAAKRGCFVYGNDLNPESARSMEENRKKNHIKDNLRVSCLDGREFIRGVVVANARRPWTPLELGPNGEVKTKRQEEKELAYKLLAEGKANVGDGKGGRKTSSSKGSKPPASGPHPPSGPPKLLYPSSPYIKHFIMNLPAMAVTFLDAFRGSYTGLPKDEWDKVEMPVVHCHFFDKRPLPADHAEEKAEQTLIDVRPPSPLPPNPVVFLFETKHAPLRTCSFLPDGLAPPRLRPNARNAPILPSQGPPRRPPKVDVLHRLRTPARGRLRRARRVIDMMVLPIRIFFRSSAMLALRRSARKPAQSKKRVPSHSTFPRHK